MDSVITSKLIMSTENGMTPALVALVTMPFWVLTIAFCFACRTSYKTESRPIQDIVETLKAMKKERNKDKQTEKEP